MKHWTGQAAGRVLLTGATGLSAAGCCGKLEESDGRRAAQHRLVRRKRLLAVARPSGEARRRRAAGAGSRPAGGGRHARLLAGRGLRKGSAPAALKRDEDPGRIWLQFEVNGDQAGTTLRQTAIFDPTGSRVARTGTPLPGSLPHFRGDPVKDRTGCDREPERLIPRSGGAGVTARPDHERSSAPRRARAWPRR